MMLRTETVAAPTHIGGLCVVRAEPLCDETERLDLELVRRFLAPRVAAIPELHRIVKESPPLCGPPVWVDDPDFSLERHIYCAAVPAPGDEAALLDIAELLLRPLLDRSRPLWELWILTGLNGGRLGLLFKIHHALADGLAAVRLVTSLLDDRMMVEPANQALAPTPGAIAPAARALFADNVRNRLGSLATTFRHPVRNLRSVTQAVAYALREVREWQAAPSSSLNVISRPGRRLHVLHMDLETARAAAHARGGKVNDVILAVVAGGVAALLRQRGERVEGGELIAAIGVNLRDKRTAGEGGNMVGALRVRLPVGDTDAGRLLDTIAGRTRAAKAEQRITPQSSNLVLGLVGWLATVGVSFSEHQRMINFFVSNVQGPTTRLHALGAEVEDVLPIVGLFGNETVTFVALSYCGRLNLVSVADRSACADIDILSAGMSETWEHIVAATLEEATAQVKPPQADTPDGLRPAAALKE
jgi:WS/DGAT/MGAT family acyltransferase